MKNKVNLKLRRSFFFFKKQSLLCSTCFRISIKLKSLQTENFAICFVVCFVIRGLAKNKEGKDLEDVLIACTAKVRKMRVVMKCAIISTRNTLRQRRDSFLERKFYCCNCIEEDFENKSSTFIKVWL